MVGGGGWRLSASAPAPLFVGHSAPACVVTLRGWRPALRLWCWMLMQCVCACVCETGLTCVCVRLWVVNCAAPSCQGAPPAASAPPQTPWNQRRKCDGASLPPKLPLKPWWVPAGKSWEGCADPPPPQGPHARSCPAADVHRTRCYALRQIREENIKYDQGLQAVVDARKQDARARFFEKCVAEWLSGGVVWVARGGKCCPRPCPLPPTKFAVSCVSRR
jgi:hypothetical protein